MAQDVIVREEDCGTTEGIELAALMDGDTVIVPLSEKISGRVAAAEIFHPETGELLHEANKMIDEDTARRIEAAGVVKVPVRSVLTCRTRHGVCCMCYGQNLATGRLVDVGEAVGIIAAQSIGEPGTQLTTEPSHRRRGREDITQVCPGRGLFEARNPKARPLSADQRPGESGGSKGVRRVSVISAEGEEKLYQIPYGARLR